MKYTVRMRRALSCSIAVALSAIAFHAPGAASAQRLDRVTASAANPVTPPLLGADLIYDSWPHPLIDAWRGQQEGNEMAAAFRNAGLKTLRFSFHGHYSPLGAEATERVRIENKRTNKFPWFPLDLYADFIRAHEFTTVVAVNVEEGPDVALSVARAFVDRGLDSKLVAIELSNEPWLNHRPWLPEEYASRAAEVIQKLTTELRRTPVRFALPLTVGPDRGTPTKLTDTEWVTRMLTALTTRIDLKKRQDIYGVIHLYSRGVQPGSIRLFDKVVKPFMPNVRYLVTEFNIRLTLEKNQFLTNEYAMELARRMAELMIEPDIVAMYIHAVPHHSVLIWANRRISTVNGYRDSKLPDPSPGWHLTVTGKVYKLFSELAFNGKVVAFEGSHKERYWAVRDARGKLVMTFINDTGSTKTKELKLGGATYKLTSPPRSIVCVDETGKKIETLSLPY